MKLFLLGSEINNKPVKILLPKNPPKKPPTDQIESVLLKEVVFIFFGMAEKALIYLTSFSLTEMEAL